MKNNNLSQIINTMSEKEKKALFSAVKQRKEKEEKTKNREAKCDIAIIGLGGRYPESDGVQQYWSRLIKGETFIKEIPEERWNQEAYYDPEAKKKFMPHKTCCHYGAFLKDYDKFDASFFDLSPQNVYFMEPQERLALEAVWSCMEDAGYTPESLGESVGIFSGNTYSDYQKLVPFNTHFYMMNNHISYFFNFNGPSIAVDAGCCSSLAAIHQACRSLLLEECTTACVIGSNMILHPDHYASVSTMLSSSDSPLSKPYGTDDGWIPAEGVAAVLLKPLEKAKKDRDHIYGVIKSSHISQQGRTSWFLAFSPKQQARVMEEDFNKSGISPQTISYVEVAANGSLMGDAIELESLSELFHKYAVKKGSCPIGTVKAELGHGEAVSTILQLTKVLLQMERKVLLPMSNLKELNPHLNMIESPFYLLKKREEWKASVLTVGNKKLTIPRRATLSSFGSGGSTGHLIIEEYKKNPSIYKEHKKYFIPVSSKSKEQLKELVEDYIRFLDEYKEFYAQSETQYTMSNIMFTLCTGRMGFSERIVFLSESVEELHKKMKDYARGLKGAAITVSNEEKEIQKNGKAERIGIEDILNLSREELARRWVNGASIDWITYFEKADVTRVSLPAYHFKKECYVIPKADMTTVPEAVSDLCEPDEEKKEQAENSAWKVDDGTARVIKIFSEVLHVPEEELDKEAPLDTYGFDSSIVVKITKQLEEFVGTIPVTLFFEFKNIQNVLDYLKEKYPEKMNAVKSIGKVEQETKNVSFSIDDLAAAILSDKETKKTVMEKIGR